ncbi:MAG: preprotein translocase subunit YajC [Armatimonadetes bacterium RBG_16_67_12]|nr:MAG: preprotein translocase subunit YajC [Armatimonadetes bacterium RBG_16_67_12]
MQAQQLQILAFYALILVVFYMFLIRPQRTQQRKRREMIEAIRRGDRVVTVGGIHATVADLKDDVLTLDLAPNVRVKADRSAVSYIRAKAETKAEE